MSAAFGRGGDVAAQLPGDLRGRAVRDAVYIHERHRVEAWRPARLLGRAVLRPRRVIEGVAEQGVLLGFGRLITAHRELVALAEVRGGQAVEIRDDDHVGPAQPRPFESLHHQGDRAIGDAADGLRHLLLGPRAHADRDHDVGAHVLRHVHGNVVEDAPVGEETAVEAHRVVGAGEGHRGPHRGGERTRSEDDDLSLLEVGGHAPERYGQIVEVRDIGVGQQDPAHHQAQVVAGVDAALESEASTEPRFQLDRVVAIVLFPSVGLERVRYVGAKDGVPIGLAKEFLDVGRGQARGVRRAHESAGAVPREPVHRDLVLLEPLQDAHVCHAPGRPAAQHHSDLRPQGRCGCG